MIKSDIKVGDLVQWKLEGFGGADLNDHQPQGVVVAMEHHWAVVRVNYDKSGMRYLNPFTTKTQWELTLAA